MTIFEARNLTHKYPDGNAALKNISFSLSSGEKLFVVGANGSGKSTLLFHFVATLLPTDGDLFFDGRKIEQRDKKFIAELRRRVGLVFQNPDNQLFMERVRDDIAFGPRNAGLTNEEVEERVEKAMAQAGVKGELAGRSPWRLSVGEKRLASLACVLAMRPEVLVLDEPSAFLDPRARREIINLLRGLPCAQVIATHDLDMALDLGDRVLVLDKGELVSDGKIPGILTDKDFLESHRLELPLSIGKNYFALQ